jgi:hypothetical protein
MQAALTQGEPCQVSSTKQKGGSLATARAYKSIGEILDTPWAGELRRLREEVDRVGWKCALPALKRVLVPADAF